MASLKVKSGPPFSARTSGRSARSRPSSSDPSAHPPDRESLPRFSSCGKRRVKVRCFLTLCVEPQACRELAHIGSFSELGGHLAAKDFDHAERPNSSLATSAPAH